MDLIQRILQGDWAIYADIMSWYAEDVLRLSYSLLWNSEEAKDVLQETLLRLVRTIREGKIRHLNGSIKGLLMRTARNLCIDRLRQRVDFHSVDEEETQSHPRLQDTRTPDRELEEARFQERFEFALAQLSDVQRTVIVLHELNQESHQEIAESLHLSVDNVKAHLCRARRKMRILLKPYLE